VMTTGPLALFAFRPVRNILITRVAFHRFRVLREYHVPFPFAPFGGLIS
jgi:hypothetical protein